MINKPKNAEPGFFLVFRLTDDEEITVFGPGKTYTEAARNARQKAHEEARKREEWVEKIVCAGRTRDAIAYLP